MLTRRRGGRRYHSGLGTLPVGQLLVEFHAEHASGGVEGTIAPLLQMLADDGYRVFSTEPNTFCDTCSHGSLMEYSFIKVARSGHVYGAGGHMHAGARKRRTEA